MDPPRPHPHPHPHPHPNPTPNPNQVWINLGPLLWHYSDNPCEVSVDLTWDEVRPLLLDLVGVRARISSPSPSPSP